MIAIVKYNAGNIRSVKNALDRIGVESVITDDPETLNSAEKVIFPGVGEAGTAMSYLKERGLDEVIISLKQPFLGICLGMQLMCSHSEEKDTTCLGIFKEKVRKFPSKGIVPHMGWNDFTKTEGPLFEGITTTDNMYFVHSYYAEVGEDTVGETDYLVPFTSALQKDNFYGVQFHPEKSADVGQKLLENFLKL
ncbi:imidazole glycerol phosphate synthase subunit hisH [Ekhidna lutea]|uniref:Imidazole glycerol phosphate synthase subunit HisH n=1 Tax=Ekhidna lutea TaxID=447679 RepID=A0A239J4F2_EKHLU|nr:imidazole glycerol phosphate synthase subunit HisH [Ekhidna lutea]SNT00727.1 imidazole glycerol phosphate synthase subunit hisH [Ekhidna lutea]